MLTEWRALPVAKSMTDGTPRPTASAEPAVWVASTRWSTSPWVDDVSVWRRTGGETRPSCSVATDTFVPPTSTPITRVGPLTGRALYARPPCRSAAHRFAPRGCARRPGAAPSEAAAAASSSVGAVPLRRRRRRRARAALLDPLGVLAEQVRQVHRSGHVEQHAVREELRQLGPLC